MAKKQRAPRGVKSEEEIRAEREEREKECEKLVVYLKNAAFKYTNVDCDAHRAYAFYKLYESDEMELEYYFNKLSEATILKFIEM